MIHPSAPPRHEVPGWSAQVQVDALRGLLGLVDDLAAVVEDRGAVVSPHAVPSPANSGRLIREARRDAATSGFRGVIFSLRPGFQNQELHPLIRWGASNLITRAAWLQDFAIQICIKIVLDAL